MNSEIINSLTLGQFKELQALLTAPAQPGGTMMELGQKVFIRTCTNYFLGRVAAVSSEEVRLTCASWVADTGRFGEFLASGKPNEVEPYPNGCVVRLAAVVDWSHWSHELPTEAK